jgi:hypothetical protein
MTLNARRGSKQAGVKGEIGHSFDRSGFPWDALPANAELRALVDRRS